MKAFLVVLTALVVMHLLMLSTLRIYPMNDLPFHLAVSTIHKYYNDPSNYFAEYYYVDLFPGPNCVHPLFCGLGIFPGVEVGNKVYYGLYLVLLPLSVLLVTRTVGGNHWLALLSLLLLYNYSFSWGFTGYTMAIPLTVLALYFHLTSLKSGNPVHRIVLAVLLAGLYFMHALAGAYCALLFALSVILHNRRSFRNLLRELLPVLPLAGLAVWWMVSRSQEQGDLHREILAYYRSDYLASLSGRTGLLHLDHSHVLAGSAGKVVGTLISLCIAGPLIAGVLLKRRSFQDSLGRPEVKSVLLFLVATLACFVLLPPGIPGVFFIFKRMSVFALIWSVILLALVFRGRLHRPAIVAVCAACLAYAALWGHYFREFEAENDAYTAEFLPQNSRDKTLISHVLDRRFRGAFIYTHFGDYHVVWNLGITKGTYSEFKFVGVWPKKPEEWPLPRWTGRAPAEHRLTPYSTSDFILVRGEPDRRTESTCMVFDSSALPGNGSSTGGSLWKIRHLSGIDAVAIASYSAHVVGFVHFLEE